MIIKAGPDFIREEFSEKKVFVPFAHFFGAAILVFQIDAKTTKCLKHYGIIMVLAVKMNACAPFNP